VMKINFSDPVSCIIIHEHRYYKTPSPFLARGCVTVVQLVLT
jgi:hypothetical protein